MNLYFYVFIGVNVLSLLLCLYMVIKSLKFYKLDNYPFFVFVCMSYIDKFDQWVNRNWCELGQVIFRFAIIIIYLLLQSLKKSSDLLGFLVTLLWFMTLFLAYGFISDFFILIIKTGRCVRDFFIYLKTKRVYGIYFYKFSRKGKWKSCFFTNEFKKGSLFKCGIELVAFFIVLVCVDYGFNLLVFKLSDYRKKIFSLISGSSLLIAFLFFLIHNIIKFVFFFKNKVLKIKNRYDLLKTVSFYPSGNVREICFFRNRYLCWIKSFFDKKNRLSLYKYFGNNWNLDSYRGYFYSGNIAFEFFKSNKSIVYYRDNPRKEVVAEAFFDEYRSLIYFVEYDVIKIFNGKNVKNEIVYKDGKYIGWKYLKLGKETFITQNMEEEEVENILQQFDLKFKRI